MHSKQESRAPLALVLILIAVWSVAVVTSKASSVGLHSKKYVAQSNVPAQAKPRQAPARWRGLIGEYGPDDDILIILEKDGRLCALFKGGEPEPLEEAAKNIFKFPAPGPHATQQLIFARDAH